MRQSLHAHSCARPSACINTPTSGGLALLAPCRRRTFRCFSSSSSAQPARTQQQQQQQQVQAASTHQEQLGVLQAGGVDAAPATTSSRRQTLAAAAALATSLACASDLVLLQQPAQAAELEGPDLTVTDRVYLDVGVAASAFKPAGERTLGDKTVLPADAEPAGRIVLGLYGKLAPVTVSNLVAAVRAGVFNGSAFSKISPGEFLQLGKQGSRRLGDVEPPPGLQVNTDLAAPGPFKLTHSRPGTVSLSLSDNDEDPKFRERSDYRQLEFLITTGPGPVPRLDGLNPVFGRVESGMDVVARLAQVQSFQPDIRSQQLNRFAAFIGDDRADNVRRQYGRPLRAIIISGSGVLSAAADAAAKQQQGSLALSAGAALGELP